MTSVNVNIKISFKNFKSINQTQGPYIATVSKISNYLLPPPFLEFYRSTTDKADAGGLLKAISGPYAFHEETHSSKIFKE